MAIWSEPRLQPETMRLSEFPASRGESAAAAAGETFEELPVFQVGKVREMQDALGEREDLGEAIGRLQAGEDLNDVVFGERRPAPQTPIAEARERVKAEGLESTLKLPQRDTIPTRALDIMVDRARARRQREQVISRGPQDWTQTALSAGTSFLVGAIDPLNIASGFIPVFGELRYGKMLADAGFSTARRAGVAAAQGAGSGALGTAALQPLDAYSRTLEGQDWHFAHSLQNVLFGAALGGVLMGGGRVAGDVLRARAGRPLYPFDVGELLDDHPAWSELRRSIETAPLRTEPGGELPTLPERFPGAPGEAPPRSEAAAADAVPVARDPRVAEENRIAIADDITTRLRAAGMADDEIDANAAIVAARYNARAERLGVDPLELYRAEGIDVRLNVVDVDGRGRTLFQSDRPTAPTFFSAVQRAVEALPQPKASAAQWLATIRNRGGVKAEEFEWLGLEDWLKQQNGAVTKEAVLDYVRANRIEVRDVMVGENPEIQAKKARIDALTEELRALPEGDHPRRGAIIDERMSLDIEVDAYGATTAPRYGEYTLPGGKDYRELLLTLPERRPASHVDAEAINRELMDRYGDLATAFEQWTPEEQQRFDAIHARASGEPEAGEYRSSHWNEPNVLAHVRFNDRIIDGKRTLLVEEVQSDWHQAGRRRGYGNGDRQTRDRAAAAVDRMRPRVHEMLERNDRLGFESLTQARSAIANEDPRQWEFDTPADLELAVQFNAMLAASRVKIDTVPDAPFKTTWPELVLKRMIRYAADNGYDQIAWTPGKVQAERYDLSKQISEIAFYGSPDKGGSIVAKDLNGAPVIRRRVDNPSQDLPDIIGKEAAEKLLSAKPKASEPASDNWLDLVKDATGRQEVRIISGLDLQVGGEGMEAFYDRELVNVANKLGKKYGAKVGRSELQHEGSRDAFRAAERTGDAEAIADAAALKTTSVHTLPITPELRQAATSEGFPLFQGGDAPRGQINLADGRAIVTLFGNADRSTFMHEMGHLWLDELARDASRANVPQALKDDLGTVLRWLGVDKAEDIGVAQHEQWATGFEQYLREGRAPSHALARAFDSFKRWLTEIYRTVAGLGRPIADDIRGVMDRMLATERELAEIVADLPPRAHEDAMRAAVASLVDGTPVRSAELLAAGAQGDRGIAAALVGLERPAAEAAAKLEPPASTRVAFEGEPQGASVVRKSPSADAETKAGAETPTAEPAVAPASPSAKAAIDAERVATELYDAEVAAGYVQADNAKLVEALNAIDQDHDARMALVRQGAACLLAGFGALAR